MGMPSEGICLPPCPWSQISGINTYHRNQNHQQCGRSRISAIFSPSDGIPLPRCHGPGISQSDILVINKTDLAPYVNASLEVMDHDSRLMRPGKPFVFTNSMKGDGIDELVDLIFKMALFDKM